MANELGLEERRKLPSVIKSKGSFGLTLVWRGCVDSILKKSGMKRWCCGRNAIEKMVFIRGNEKK